MTNDESVGTAADERQALASLAFVEIVNALVGDFDVIDVLAGLVNHSVQLLDVAAAGILLADPAGNLVVTATSGSNAHLLELFQVQNEQGPCVDCYTTANTVHHAELDQSTPWPAFATIAVNAGFLSVCAVPMRLKETTIGCLNLFMTDGGELGPADSALAQALADVATIAIIHDQATRDAVLRESALQHALESRIVIEQAKGMIAERYNIDVTLAFNRLRAYTRKGGHLLAETAEAIVSGQLNMDALIGPRIPPPHRAPADTGT